MDNLIKQAIDAALHQDWHRAVSLNSSILESDSVNTGALIRLAYAHTRLGDKDKAKILYKKVLSIDKYNHIAKKNLENLNSLPNLKVETGNIMCASQLLPSMFIEEPGRTKTVSLINLAPITTIIKLRIGDKVILHAKKHTVEVRTVEKSYIGAIPDDVSFRLVRFLEAGNEYDVYIRKVSSKCIMVFIKELRRGKKFKNQPTFYSMLNSQNSPILGHPKRDSEEACMDELG